MSEITYALEEKKYPVEIKWALEDKRSLGQGSAAWYTSKIDPELVCTVSCDGWSIPVYRVGEMILKIRDEEMNWIRTIRYSEELESVDILNDEDILRIIQEHASTYDNWNTLEFDELPFFHVGAIEHGAEKEENYIYRLSEAIIEASKRLSP